MSIPGFGNVVPIHFSILSLAGWELETTGSRLLQSDAERLALTLSGGGALSVLRTHLSAIALAVLILSWAGCVNVTTGQYAVHGRDVSTLWGPKGSGKLIEIGSTSAESVRRKLGEPLVRYDDPTDIFEAVPKLAGRLDLTNNFLALDYTGATPIGAPTAGTYNGVTGMIQSARNGGAWNGATGITTSMPDVDAGRRCRTPAATGVTTLAVAEAANVLGISGAQTALWNGQTVDATTVLVKYTYAGDNTATRMPKSIVPGTSGYWNGDFNFDGVINGDDYGEIDFAIIAQGAAL